MYSYQVVPTYIPFSSISFCFSAPSRAPGKVVVAVTSLTSITVTWDDIPPIDHNGIILMYRVLYTPVNMPGSSQTIEVNEQKAIFFGINASINFTIAVQAYTRVGEGPYSTTFIRREFLIAGEAKGHFSLQIYAMLCTFFRFW